MCKFFTPGLILGACLCSSNSFSQSNTFPTTGNVGIGTASPLLGTNNMGMHIMKGDHSSIILGDPVNGGHGGIVQTSDNQHRIFIGANLYDDQFNSWKNFASNKGGSGLSIIADKGGWGSNISFYVTEENNNVLSRLIIRSNGNIGIGTDFPTDRLSVNGNIRAHEIKIETENWPDYVFKSDYKLISLAQTELFIQENGHLPEVPPVEQIVKEGLSVGEMNKLMMRKIEELTLHLIEKEKQLMKQDQRLREIEIQMDQMKKSQSMHTESHLLKY